MNINQKGFAPIIIALMVLVLAGIGGASYYLITKQSPKQTACTTEAKICPDGSSVGRTGPNCEFATCPEVKTDEVLDEIKTGKITINFSEVAELQKAVDDGHQPWRLNLFDAASADLQQYGFTQDDLKFLQCPHIASNWVVGKDITSLSCEISHNSLKYTITVSQPQPGIGKIWMISEIESN